MDHELTSSSSCNTCCNGESKCQKILAEMAPAVSLLIMRASPTAVGLTSLFAFCSMVRPEADTNLETSCGDSPLKIVEQAKYNRPAVIRLFKRALRCLYACLYICRSVLRLLSSLLQFISPAHCSVIHPCIPVSNHYLHVVVVRSLTSCLLSIMQLL